jgi:hypothetical protein
MPEMTTADTVNELTEQFLERASGLRFGLEFNIRVRSLGNYKIFKFSF